MIIQYEGLSRFLFSFGSGLVEPGRVLDISGCFLNLDHIHCFLSMFCSPFVLLKSFVDFWLLIVAG